MSRKRDDVKANAMYEHYKKGHSLEVVAMAFSVTRQSVYKMFKKRGFTLRKKPTPLSFVVFNSEKYTLRKVGYYGKTNKCRSYLHRDVWEFHNGKIPEGFDIHHIDRDKSNNRISNLELISKSEHASKYNTGKNQFTKH